MTRRTIFMLLAVIGALFFRDGDSMEARPGHRVRLQLRNRKSSHAALSSQISLSSTISSVSGDICSLDRPCRNPQKPSCCGIGGTIYRCFPRCTGFDGGDMKHWGKADVGAGDEASGGAEAEVGGQPQRQQGETTRTVTVIIVRHGESTWNPVAHVGYSHGRWGKGLSGSSALEYTDAPLTMSGIVDGKKFNEALIRKAQAGDADALTIFAQDPKFIEFFVSPLTRAYDTALWSFFKDPKGNVRGLKTVRMVPFAQEICSNTDCTAKVQPGIVPQFDDEHNGVVTYQNSKRLQEDPEHVDGLVGALAVAQTAQNVQQRKKKEKAANQDINYIQTMYRKFDMSMWNEGTARNGKYNGQERFLLAIADAAARGLTHVFMGGHSMWIGKLGNYLTTQNLADVSVKTHTSQIFLRGQWSHLKGKDKIDNGAALKLVFEVTLPTKNEESVMNGDWNADTRGVKEFLGKHVPPAMVKEMVTKYNSIKPPMIPPMIKARHGKDRPGREPKQKLLYNKLKKDFGSSPLAKLPKLKAVSIFHQGQRGHAYPTHTLFGSGDDAFVVQKYPKNPNSRGRCHERLMRVKKNGRAGGNSVVVEYFEFGGTKLKGTMIISASALRTVVDVGATDLRKEDKKFWNTVKNQVIFWEDKDCFGVGEGGDALQTYFRTGKGSPNILRIKKSNEARAFMRRLQKAFVPQG